MANLWNPVHGSIVAIGPYYVANIDTAATNTDLAIAQTGVAYVRMPRKGTIIGLSVENTAAVTAGSATFSIHSASTEISGGPTAVVDTTNTTGSYGAASSARTHTFAAGARLGISVSTTTTLAATTVDYNATLFVRFDPD